MFAGGITPAARFYYLTMEKFGDAYLFDNYETCQRSLKKAIFHHFAEPFQHTSVGKHRQQHKMSSGVKNVEFLILNRLQNGNEFDYLSMFYWSSRIKIWTMLGEICRPTWSQKCGVILGIRLNKKSGNPEMRRGQWFVDVNMHMQIILCVVPLSICRLNCIPFNVHGLQDAQLCEREEKPHWSSQSPSN